MKVIIDVDDMNRQYIASCVGQGKSTIAKMMAQQNNYLYINEENSNIDSLSGIEWEETVKDFNKNGIVFDYFRMNRLVTDWNIYEWKIPFFYTVQLNRLPFRKEFNMMNTLFSSSQYVLKNDEGQYITKINADEKSSLGKLEDAYRMSYEKALEIQKQFSEYKIHEVNLVDRGAI